MKILQIAILATFLLACFSATIKRKSFLAQNQDQICEQFAKATFKKLNEQITQNGYGQLGEEDFTLRQTAYQQAQEIITYNNFGQHARFAEEAQIIPNEYFSEITVRANIQTLPTEDVFATELLQNILEQNNSLLQHEYTNGAVAIINQDASTYVIVIHLLKKKQQMFENCLQAQQAGITSNVIEVILNGNKQLLSCDQTTADGGWTLIADVNAEANGQGLIIPIDDKGLSYTELLFVKKPEFNFGWWETQNYLGFVNSLNYWRFDTTWFFQFNSNQEVTDAQYYSQNDIEILKKTDTGDQLQFFQVADQIIFKNLPQNKRINAFSDQVSVVNPMAFDNHYNYAFYLYVR